MKAKGLFLLIFLFFFFSSNAQRIFYSEPDRDDMRQMRFEILGKYNNQYLIYKNIRSKHYMCVYDPEMKMKDKIDLDFIPDRVITVDLFSLSDRALLFYQFEKKNVVYLMGVQFDGSGKKLGEPMELDTTKIGGFSDNKVYSIISSDDKKKLMAFKMKIKQRDDFHFQTLLMSNTLIPIRRTSFNYKLENNKESIADFYLDNEGNFLFTHVSRPGQREYISQAKLATLKTYSDTVKVFPLQLKDIYLDELRIKVDNTNGRYVLTSLYSKTKRGNIDGLFVSIISNNLEGPDIERTVEFSEDFRAKAKGDASLKLTFNDYYLKHFIIKKDGGILITGESSFTNSRNNNFNRWDNPWMWNNPWNNYWGWNPWNNWGWSNAGWNSWGWGRPWGMNSFGPNQQTRYFSENIIILSLDKDASLQWENVVNKSQYDDNTDNMLSYQIMNSGAELLFLYNEWNRRTPMLNAHSLSADGKVNKEPPLKSLDKGYEFMIRFGKQVGAREMIVPAIYRNAFSFARIDF
jgi:hypothetical protein